MTQHSTTPPLQSPASLVLRVGLPSRVVQSLVARGVIHFPAPGEDEARAAAERRRLHREYMRHKRGSKNPRVL